MKNFMKAFFSIVVASLLVLTGNSQTVSESVILKINPNPLELNINDPQLIEITAMDENGKVLEGRFGARALRHNGSVPSSGLEVTEENMAIGRVPGNYRLIIFWGDTLGHFQMEYLSVKVLNSAISSIVVENLPHKIYEGSIVPLEYVVKDDLGHEVSDIQVKASWKDGKVAEVDVLDNLYAKKVGKSTLTFQAGEIKTEIPITVLDNPVDRIEITSAETIIRTGDVTQFHVESWDKKNNSLTDVKYNYSVSSSENESASGASAIIEQDGRMVAENAGYYTVVASVGNISTQKTIRVLDRESKGQVEVVGRASVGNQHSSDLWVWQGVDGRDYAVTGTIFADGKAYFWDVTDPANITKIDSIQVDARNVNDVKVSEDGRTCVITREGASSRKNGIVILDVTDPRDVKEHATYTENLTGGVHNCFIHDNHVYALSNGQKYEIINIEDPKNPYRVGHFELENPARSIHDVWVVDGIAYSANWNDGLYLVDVGNGVAGGSPSNPVVITTSKVFGDANHSCFPFRSKSTGKFYIVAGDEIFPNEWFENSSKMLLEPFNPSGYLHILDFSDIRNPKEVARYEVPEAGSHNLWVEDDILYVGYYNGGVRVVDLSGDLMGDLYKQGREIGSFIPKAKDGVVKNHAMTWGAQPHKGHVFFTDMNSGLWSAKVVPNEN
jgi:hypothetical protein